jgi:HEAT repeat protein
VENDKERASIAAVFALGEIQDESKIPFLVSLFHKMRGYEVMALIKYGEKAVPAMFREIATTDQDYVREQAERVLLSIRDQKAIPLFEKEMEKHDSPSRNVSIRALLNIDAERTLPRLLQLWERENDSVIASLVLDHLDHFQITDSRYAMFAVKILRTSPKNDLRKNAASILGRIGGESAKKALKDGLKDNDPLVRAFAARSLKYLELHPTSKSKK